MQPSEDAQRSFREIINDHSKFTGTYATFALLMIAIFACRSFLSYWKLFFIVLVYLLIYLRSERQLQEVIHKMSTSSSYFRRTPYFLISHFFLLLTMSIVGFYYGFGFSLEKSKTITSAAFSKAAKIAKIADYAKNISKSSHNRKIYFYATPDIAPDNTLFSIYFASLFQSIIVFMMASSLKCFLLGTGIIKLKIVRRGFFGIFQRFFIILRNLIVLPIWVDFFCEPSVHLIKGVINGQNALFFSHSKKTLEELIQSKKPFWCLTYIVIKLFLQLWLLGDLGAVIYDYSANKRASYKHVDDSQVSDDCVICQDKPEEPVQLSCGHIFCYRCVYRWLKDHDTCPICRKKFIEPRIIEISDGYVPIATLLSPF